MIYFDPIEYASLEATIKTLSEQLLMLSFGTDQNINFMPQDYYKLDL